jgi:dTMP kinase
VTTPPSSDPRPGLFVSVDGPAGAGKTTIVRHLAQLLAADGEQVHVTAEPSAGPIGEAAATLTATVTGNALACLYAADRYHHIETEIEPHLRAGHLVISDRYVASGLVVQRFDDVDPEFLWHLNARAKRPDLAVILQADPSVIAERLEARGPHNRFQLLPESSHAEVEYYQQATAFLDAVGYTILRVDCSGREPQQTAAAIRDHLRALPTVKRSSVLTTFDPRRGDPTAVQSLAPPPVLHQPTQQRDVSNSLAPGDDGFHADNQLLANLAQVNTRVGRYVLEHLNEDTGRASSHDDDRDLGMQLVRLGLAVLEQADERNQPGHSNQHNQR